VSPRSEPTLRSAATSTAMIVDISRSDLDELAATVTDKVIVGAVMYLRKSPAGTRRRFWSPSVVYRIAEVRKLP
jgi:hypothetical protein